MTHDPMCRIPYPVDDPTDCDCDLIARVRAQIADAIESALIPNARNTNPGAEYLNDGLVLAARIARGESHG